MVWSSFRFIDCVAEVKRNENLTAFYELRSDEEFLKDHFSGFPVMPGVLLLESLRQAGSLLVSISENFEHPFYRMAAADEVKFGQFVKPGQRIRIFVRWLGKQGARHSLDGRVDAALSGDKALSARLFLDPVTFEPEEGGVLQKTARLISEELGARL